ncbi:MAG: hypothetical protein ACLQBJ_18265 [Bryobacteraceae bacterium]
MSMRLKSRLVRLERIEAASRLVIRIRIGEVKRLPPEYTGERHLVVVKQLPPNSYGLELVEFEERPGLAPQRSSGPSNERIININICLVGPAEGR